ncbi:Tcp11-domain-containing protein, partial [Polychaeton citri CBS 116435]
EIYAPPAHLAARFYKNKLDARRKSSATSSRRNSLSSAQSHGSSGLRRRFQSDYIAQHLRRASIIESRKARLADRAAHAEQVRLRAALAKATPRDVSHSEEKALAAQLAKQKYLAKVAAACAEEVARAKRIAEEVKERKLEEERKQRFEMEERHAEAERRRVGYQRNLQARRIRRAESVEKKLAILDEVANADDEAVIEIPVVAALDDETAACRIQRMWRLYNTASPLRHFLKMDLNRIQAEATGFEEMTALIADNRVIQKTTGILTHLGLQEIGDDNATLNTRTFLSAFLIIGNPEAVLNNMNGAQEKDLLAKATELVAQFEEILQTLSRWNEYTANPTSLETLSQTYSSYTSAFAAWRLQDSSILVEGMVASFVELDAIWQTVKDDTRGEVASDYREGIRDNQVMLLSRIRKLAGPDRADFLIKKAIRESRRRRPKKRTVNEVRPRVAEKSDQGEDFPLVDSSTSEPVSFVEMGKLFTAMPTNRELTHELVIDKDYKLDESTNARLRDEVYRYICDSMRAGFENGEGPLWTLSAAENVREKLLRMLKPGNSMHNLISERLDLEQIKRECDHGVFSYSDFFSFMVTILPKLCAPFRDEQVRTLAEYLDTGSDELAIMIEKLFRLLRTVDLLSLDYSNFMIMSAAPTLIREAAGYEQRAFAKDLEAGNITLERTKRWWHEAWSALTNEASRRDPDGIRDPADRPTSQKTYAKALVDLAMSQASIDAHQVPEALSLDTFRLQTIQQETLRMTVVSAILLTTKNLLKRDVRSQWKPEANRLWTLLKLEGYSDASASSTPPSQLAFSILESAHNLPPATKLQLQSTISRFFAQASAGCLTDPVLKVLFARLKSHILARLSAATSSEKVRLASSASTALASCGLAEFSMQVSAIVDTLGRVTEVDWESHGIWHKDIFGSV